MSVNQAFVAEQIAKGVYSLSQRHKGRSFIWNILSEVLKEDGTVLQGLVYCRTCRKLLKYTGNQSSNLSRHKCCLALKEPQVLKAVSADDQRNAIDACTAWTIEDCRPISAINGAGFVKLVDFFIKIGAAYGENVDVKDLLPDPTTIARELVNSAVERKNELRSEIKEVIESGGASATVHMWTDNNVKRNFLGVTLHYQKDSQLFDTVLGMKSMDLKTSAVHDILRKLKSLFSEFGVENIEDIKFVTDNRENNIVTALEDCTRLNCSSQLLANVLDKAFDETVELREIRTELCKKILIYTQKEDFQHRLPSAPKLYPTQWSSNYTLFKFIADNWLYITEILTEQKAGSINISTLNVLVELCKIFEIISEKLQICSTPSLCFVLPSIRKFKSLCVPHNADVAAISALKAKILQNVEDIWVKSLSMWHKAACFLYPPAVGMQPKDLNDIKEFCISRINSLEEAPIDATGRISSITCESSSPPTISAVPASHISFTPSKASRSPNLSSSSNIDLEFFFPHLLRESAEATPETPREEVDRYSLVKVKITEDFDLIEWWRLNAENYPRLSTLALQIHSIPASSAAAERAFSLAGNIIPEKRKSLRPKIVDSLMFLHSNYKKFNK